MASPPSEATEGPALVLASLWGLASAEVLVGAHLGRRLVAWGIGALALVACSARDPSEPGSSAVELADGKPEGERCGRCHAQITAEWAESQHHTSNDATFRASLGREATPEFCRGCHAPFDAPSVTEAASVGLSCSSCHGDVRLGPIGHPHPPRPDASALNATCGQCHEFAFPGLRRQPEKLQLTVSEHAASSYAGTACVSCHMPRVAGQRESERAHASHAFGEARSEGELRAALAVDSDRVAPTRVRVVLRSLQVGHAFPTGDLYRRLRIEAEVVGPDYAVLAHIERALARHFGDVSAARDHLERVALVDDRVLPDVPTVVELDLGATAYGRPVTWRVRYERVLHLDPKHEEDAVVESSVLLASGTLSEKP